MTITQFTAAQPPLIPAPLPADRLDAAAAMLARAFVDDPAGPYLTPDPAQTIPTLAAFFRATVRDGLAHGEVLALGDPAQAVAIWHTVTNDRAEMPEPDLSELLGSVDDLSRDRWLAAFGVMGAVHARLMPEPHTYLAVLGVAPEHQGRGLGSALIAPPLARSRARGLPCYLETFNPKNLPLYERHGFRVAHAAPLPGSTVTLWGMRRD